jgi:hypothetical protein
VEQACSILPPGHPMPALGDYLDRKHGK